MAKKKYAAAAALLVMALFSGVLFSACGDNGSIPVSNASGIVQPDSGNLKTSDSALSTQSDEKSQTEKDSARKDKAPADTGGDTNGSVSAQNGSPYASNDSNGADTAPGAPPSASPPASTKPSVGLNSPNAKQMDDSYFDDALFIGDSLTEGFQLHGGINNATYYGFKNLNIKEVFDKPMVKDDGQKITIAAAIKKHSFGKYFIMLGANELGWVYPDVFIKKYGELIDLIREENPDAVIYLQSVLPVTSEASANSKVYSNDRINYFDKLISDLAAEKDVTYLNVREAVQNKDGVLPDDAATDGVHLNKSYCVKWADYLRDHV